MHHLALLRAINVGGHTVKMADLQQLFVEMGFANVQTYIQSGNVIFESEEANPQKLESIIEHSLQAKLGYEVVTFVRNPNEMQAVVANNPFATVELNKETVLYVAYLKERPSAELATMLESLHTNIDQFKVGEREIYWLYYRQNGQSAFTRKPLEKQIKTTQTIRNWNVTRKLAKLVNQP